MSRILLADDSPHAQRMGERILRDEGFEVVTVTDGHTALVRLADVDPDLILADVSLPGRSGYEICREVKSLPRFKHVRVILTAGLLEKFDDVEAAAVGSDGSLKKPFEASLLMEMLRPLVDAARADRPEGLEPLSEPVVPVRVLPDGTAETGPSVLAAIAEAKADHAERVRAAVTVALDAAMPSMIDEITGRILAALERPR